MAKGSISHLRGLWGGRRWLGQLKHLSRKDAVGIQNTVNPLELFHRGTKACRDGTKSVPNLHCYSHKVSLLYRYYYSVPLWPMVIIFA
jgi:hypothetical protein